MLSTKITAQSRIYRQINNQQGKNGTQRDLNPCGSANIQPSDHMSTGPTRFLSVLSMFFFGRVFGIFDVSGLDTEHESVFFLGPDPVYAAGG